MDDILVQLKQSLSMADEKTKRALTLKLRDLANSLETPDNTLDRIAFGVSQNLLFQRGGLIMKNK